MSLPLVPMSPAHPVPCSQVVPVSIVTHGLRGNDAGAMQELLFQASAPALGFSTFTVTRSPHGGPRVPPVQPPVLPQPWDIHNEAWALPGVWWSPISLVPIKPVLR